MEIQATIAALSALAQETRLTVFRRLVAAGPAGLSPGHLADALSLPAATLSFHLKELHGAELVRRRKDGRSLIYSADYGAVESLVGYLMDNCCRRPAATDGRRG
jgi:DNA-binding transcriptional ArsR family regulator